MGHKDQNKHTKQFDSLNKRKMTISRPFSNDFLCKDNFTKQYKVNVHSWSFSYNSFVKYMRHNRIVPFQDPCYNEVC